MKTRFFLVILAVLLLCGCAAHGENVPEIHVVASNFPCYELVCEVVGESAGVQLMVRPGTDAHTFEPAPADVLAVCEADVFVCIGGSGEQWTEDVLASAGEGTRLVRLMDSVEALEEEHAHEEEHAEDISYDEHIWTSPVNMRRMLSSVEEALCAAYPESAQVFHENAAAYDAELANLDQAFRDVVAKAERTELVFADRFPFLYFAREYGLDYLSPFNGCSEETQPSVQAMAALIEAVEEDGVPAVYIIEMSTGDIARAIQEETGVEILKMHSCQSVSQEEFAAGESYLSLMWDNVEALKAGLW